MGRSSSAVSSSSSVACCSRRLGAERATSGSDVVEPLELLEPDLGRPVARSAPSRLSLTRRLLLVTALDGSPYDSSSLTRSLATVLSEYFRRTWPNV